MILTLNFSLCAIRISRDATQNAINTGYDCQIGSIAFAADGGIVAAGYTDTPSKDLLLALAKYKVSGGLDASFGSGGTVISTITALSTLTGLAIDSDQNIITGGYIGDSLTGTFALTKYDSSGQLVRSFGTDGIVTTLFPGSSAGIVVAVITDANNNIYAGGVSILSRPDLFSFAVVKYNSNGVLDANFGDAGIVIISPHGSPFNVVTSLALDSDGNLVVGGVVSYPESFILRFALIKLDSAGNLVHSFGTDGIVVADIIPGSESTIYSIALDPLSNIYAAGSVVDVSGTEICAVAKYDKFGALVKSFGDNGSVLTNMSSLYPPNGGALNLNSLFRSIQFSNNLIIAGGYATKSGRTTLNALAIYNPLDGKLLSYFMNDVKDSSSALNSILISGQNIYGGGYSDLNSKSAFTMSYYDYFVSALDTFTNRLIQKYSNKV